MDVVPNDLSMSCSKLSFHEERSNEHCDISTEEPICTEDLPPPDGNEGEISNNSQRPHRIAVKFEDGSSMEENFCHLERYFATTQSSGGHKIKKIRLSFDKTTLFITYEKSVSQELLEKNHTYRERSLTVTALEPEVTDDGDQSLGVGVSLKGKDKHFIKMASPLLHNFLKQHNIEVVNEAYNKYLDSWICTFKNRSDIFDLFGNEGSQISRTIENTEFTIFMITNDVIDPWINGTIEGNMFLVTCLPPDICEDELKSFLEKNSSNSVLNLEIQSGRAMVTFKEHLDFKKLAEAIRRIPLKGYMVGIQKVRMSLSLLVSSNGKELNEEDLDTDMRHYAQECTGIRNEGFVEGVVVEPQFKMKAIVKFLDRQVLNEVLNLAQSVGTLTLYHECFHDFQCHPQDLASQKENLVTSLSSTTSEVC